MTSPTPTPATAVQDPYGGSAPEDGIHFINMSPTPGTPTDGSSSLLRLYVPADTSWIEMGATNPPGIRMHAVTHVMAQAETPLSTIQLGTPIGGIDIQTQGLKNEYTKGTSTDTVVGALTEIYQNTKNETVTGALTETYQNTKTETVTLKVTENYNNIKEENVTGPLTATVTNLATNHYNGGLTETVTGMWGAKATGGMNFEVTGGDIKLKASGNVKSTSMADSNWLVSGDSKWMSVGKFNKIVVGIHSDTRLAIHLDTRVGAHVDTKLGVIVETRAALQGKIGGVRPVKQTLHALSTNVWLATSNTTLGKAAFWVSQATYEVHK